MHSFYFSRLRWFVIAALQVVISKFIRSRSSSNALFLLQQRQHEILTTNAVRGGDPMPVFEPAAMMVDIHGVRSFVCRAE